MNRVFLFLSAIALSAAVLGPLPAVAGSDKGGVAQKSNELPSQNPEATAVNLRNSLVVHAGPGKPYIGGVYAPAAPNEKGKKK